MLITNILISILVIIGFAGFLAKRLLTYLHAFQQEEYDSPRFIGWIFMHRVFDRKVSAILLITAIASFFAQDYTFIINLLVFCAFAVIGYTEKDPRKDSKKKLAMTNRAKRIYFIALGIGLIPSLFVFFTSMPLIWILLVQFIPLLLVIANTLLQPMESATQKKFWNEAHGKLLDLSPTVIGITGSFGKTSVKHILGHILSSYAPTLITPGSVNTPMGITRIIREELNETHRYFIAEMGAYGRGSIDRLCRLAPPNIGVVTAIGHAHYERFKTLEAVAETKYELAQSVIKREGKAIVQEKTLRFPYTRDMKNANDTSFIVCGSEENNDLYIKQSEQTLNGLKISLQWQNEDYEIEVPLFGLHHADNAALAFATACSLGIPTEIVINALKTTPQIPHRLEVKKIAKGILIDDAYNSNPLGFRSALDILYLLGQKKKTRTILITPGMVELGAQHDDVHEKIGLAAAQSCDIAIVIQPDRIRTFVSAFEKERRENQKLYEVQTFAQAQEWLDDNMQDGDIVLIENDLPDIFERVPRL